MVGSQPHQPYGEERAEEGADRVERLAQPEARAAQMRRADIGDERVARRTPDALADPIDEPRGDQPFDRWRERKNRLREGRQTIAERGQELALAKPIAQRT